MALDPLAAETLTFSFSQVAALKLFSTMALCCVSCTDSKFLWQKQLLVFAPCAMLWSAVGIGLLGAERRDLQHDQIPRVHSDCFKTMCSQGCSSWVPHVKDSSDVSPHQTRRKTFEAVRSSFLYKP